MMESLLDRRCTGMHRETRLLAELACRSYGSQWKMLNVRSHVRRAASQTSLASLRVRPCSLASLSSRSSPISCGWMLGSSKPSANPSCKGKRKTCPDQYYGGQMEIMFEED